ncbi:hypothetical protein AZF08_00120 [Bacillus gaemokensis]|nr:hypothetical protein AZF08_00120 [Bacillus gaemokensis]
MGKVSRNRKELKPHIVVGLWHKVKNEMTGKEFCNVLELPRSTFYRWLQIGYSYFKGVISFKHIVYTLLIYIAW